MLKIVKGKSERETVSKSRLISDQLIKAVNNKKRYHFLTIAFGFRTTQIKLSNNATCFYPVVLFWSMVA